MVRGPRETRCIQAPSKVGPGRSARCPASCPAASPRSLLPAHSRPPLPNVLGCGREPFCTMLTWLIWPSPPPLPGSRECLLPRSLSPEFREAGFSVACQTFFSTSALWLHLVATPGAGRGWDWSSTRGRSQESGVRPCSRGCHPVSASRLPYFSPGDLLSIWTVAVQCHSESPAFSLRDVQPSLWQGLLTQTTRRPGSSLGEAAGYSLGHLLPSRLLLSVRRPRLPLSWLKLKPRKTEDILTHALAGGHFSRAGSAFNAIHRAPRVRQAR